MNIAEYYRLKKCKGDIGVEVEMCSPDHGLLPDYIDGWRTEHDGSLGRGYEYVLHTPVPIKNLDVTLERFEKAFQGVDTTSQHSYKAGVHIHINVQDLTFTEVVNFMCAYWILENLLVRWCAPSRRGNHFCMRLSDALWAIKPVLDFCEKSDPIYLDNNDLRYGSLNPCSLHKYGSIEFRALESTTSARRLSEWATVLYRIKEGSRTYKNPKALMEGVSGAGGYEEFIYTLLGDKTKNFLFPDYQRMVQEGIWNVQSIAYSRDWKNNRNYNIFQKQKNIF